MGVDFYIRINSNALVNLIECKLQYIRLESKMRILKSVYKWK